MTGISVSAEELGKLIPYAVGVSHWVKDKSPLHAAESLMKPWNNKLRNNVENCLKQVLASIENSQFELTNAQIRYIFTQYDVDTWVHVLKLIISKAKNPAVVGDKIKSDLVEWAYHFVKEGGKDWNELFQEAGKTLSGLGHKSFQLFGEFCSLIRDCSKSVGADVIATAIAHEILCTGNMKSQRKKTTGVLFQQLVHESERLFGQSGATVGTVCFGIRSIEEVTQWNLVHFLPPEKKKRQDLRTFYSYIDKKFVGIVDELFEYHSFQNIAEAINNKYGMIPAPWKSSLKKLKEQGKPGLGWFNYNKVKTPAPGASKNTKTKNDPILPKRRTENDKLVDSFLDGEVNYYRRLSALGKFYVRRITQIAEYQQTEEAQSLLLKVYEIEIMFGLRFQKILDMTHILLTNLEVINLSRKHVNPKTSREQLLANVIQKMADDGDIVNAYSRYSTSYPEVMEMVKRKKQIKKSRSNHPGRFPDFFDIWQRERKNLKSLEDKRLEEVMLLPVKRIHTYREVLKKLYSKEKVTSQKYKDIYNAYLAVKRSADRLTELSEKYRMKMLE